MSAYAGPPPDGDRPRLAGEAGTAVVWMLGLLVLVLGLGGISLDLWRVFTERRGLAGIVDAAAVAGSSGIDETSLRGDTVALDPVRAEQLAWNNLNTQTDTGALTAAAVTATPTEITVAADGAVHLTLLRILAPDRSPVPIHVTATAEPRPVAPAP